MGALTIDRFYVVRDVPAAEPAGTTRQRDIPDDCLVDLLQFLEGLKVQQMITDYDSSPHRIEITCPTGHFVRILRSMQVRLRDLIRVTSHGYPYDSSRAKVPMPLSGA